MAKDDTDDPRRAVIYKVDKLRERADKLEDFADSIDHAWSKPVVRWFKKRIQIIERPSRSEEVNSDKLSDDEMAALHQFLENRVTTLRAQADELDRKVMMDPNESSDS